MSHIKCCVLDEFLAEVLELLHMLLAFGLLGELHRGLSVLVEEHDFLAQKKSGSLSELKIFNSHQMFVIAVRNRHRKLVPRSS